MEQQPKNGCNCFFTPRWSTLYISNLQISTMLVINYRLVFSVSCYQIEAYVKWRISIHTYKFICTLYAPNLTTTTVNIHTVGKKKKCPFCRKQKSKINSNSRAHWRIIHVRAIIKCEHLILFEYRDAQTNWRIIYNIYKSWAMERFDHDFDQERETAALMKRMNGNEQQQQQQQQICRTTWFKNTENSAFGS